MTSLKIVVSVVKTELPVQESLIPSPRAWIPYTHGPKKKKFQAGKDCVQYRGHDGHGSFGEPLVIQLRWSSK